jgi:hypothetical protein
MLVIYYRSKRAFVDLETFVQVNFSHVPSHSNIEHPKAVGDIKVNEFSKKDQLKGTK